MEQTEADQIKDALWELMKRVSDKDKEYMLSEARKQKSFKALWKLCDVFRIEIEKMEAAHQQHILTQAEEYLIKAHEMAGEIRTISLSIRDNISLCGDSPG
ncbi:hypothetical protein KDA11_04020 [Candidatus Saccharibacteria bacterium]|nr:hypothetical protein [Candidatus Saccharibacteria bacterium]